MKEERTGMTIYFPVELKKTIEERAKTFGRSQTEETIFLLKQGLEYETIRSNWILSQLKALSQERTE